MVTYLFNGQIVAETFDKYFVSVAQNIHENNHNVNSLSNHDNPISYLFRAFNQPFPTINLKSVLSKEIEDITKSLKTKNSHGYDINNNSKIEYSLHFFAFNLHT